MTHARSDRQVRSKAVAFTIRPEYMQRVQIPVNANNEMTVKLFACKLIVDSSEPDISAKQLIASSVVSLETSQMGETPVNMCCCLKMAERSSAQCELQLTVAKKHEIIQAPLTIAAAPTLSFAAGRQKDNLHVRVLRGRSLHAGSKKTVQLMLAAQRYSTELSSLAHFPTWNAHTSFRAMPSDTLFIRLYSYPTVVPAEVVIDDSSLEMPKPKQDANGQPVLDADGQPAIDEPPARRSAEFGSKEWLLGAKYADSRLTVPVADGATMVPIGEASVQLASIKANTPTVIKVSPKPFHVFKKGYIEKHANAELAKALLGSIVLEIEFRADPNGSLCAAEIATLWNSLNEGDFPHEPVRRSGP